MSSFLSRSASFTVSDELLDRLARLSRDAERADALFAVPLGPAAQERIVPRYVAFGASTTDQDARVVLLAGESSPRLSAGAVVLDFVESALREPSRIGGLVLDSYPLLSREAIDAWDRPWSRAGSGELVLLEREFRRLPPHVAIVVHVQPDSALTLGEIAGFPLTDWLEGASPELHQIGWLTAEDGAEFTSGLLTLAQDLPFRPLEIHLAVGAESREPTRAVGAVVQRIREILAFAQYL